MNPFQYIKTEKRVVTDGRITLDYPPTDVLQFGFVFGGVKDGTVLLFPVTMDEADETQRTLKVVSQEEQPAEGLEVMIQYALLIQVVDDVAEEVEEATAEITE